MSDYTLHYWPIPFRGQFIRWVLAHAGASFDDMSPDAVHELRSLPVGDQPVPLMAPPVLSDHASGITLAQLQAILIYLGGKHGLIPEDAHHAALIHKVVCDANDVLDEVTRNGGKQMWTPGEWETFADDRLPRWMAIFEETGTRFGLEKTGHLLGTQAPSLADLVTGALWFTMTDKLPQIGDLLQETAPGISGLSYRMAHMPAIADLRARTDADYGDLYCGGQIEQSLRGALAASG